MNTNLIIFYRICFLLSITLLMFCATESQAQENFTIPSTAAPDTLAMSIDLDDVVITAQYAPTDSKNALQSIRVIDRETIEQQGATSLDQLLQQDLNVFVSQDLVLGSRMSLLGVGGENVKIMIDGVPVVGRLDGNIDLSQINLNNIERVEIVEGPMSVTYGTDALGGVINLITKKSQRYPFELTLNQQLETRAESSSTVDVGFRFNDDLLIRLNVGRDWFNGFSEDSTRSVLWNPKEQWFADASLRYDFGDDHRLIYQFSYFDEEVQDLGDVRRPQFKPYAFDDLYLTKRINHALIHEGSILDNFYLQNTIGYNIFDRAVTSVRMNFEENEEVPLQGDTTAFHTFMARSILASRFRDSDLNFQLGIDLQHETGVGARIVDIESDKIGESYISDYAVFGSLRYQPTSELMLESGLRWAQNSRYDAPLIPSFHLKYQLLEGLQLRASYGQGFRSPSLKELFLSFVDINHFIIGNPNLQAETSNNFQVNLAYEINKNQQAFGVKLSTFYNQIQDQIQLFPFVEGQDGSAEATTPDQSNRYAYFNLDESKTKGINLRLDYRWKDFSIEGGLATIGFFNPLSAERNDVEEFTYSTTINGRLSYRLPAGTQISVFARKNDRFISYYPTQEDGQTVARQQIQDGFTMLDGSLSQSFFNDRLQITAGARNLLNITQINVSGGAASPHSGGGGLPIGAGRSYFVRASIRLFDNRAAKFKNRSFEQQQKEAFQIHQRDESLYASWIENQNDGERVFQFSAQKNQKWSSPKTIQIGNDSWFVNSIDAPQIAAFKNNERNLVALWLENNNPRNVYDHHILMSHSNNKGKSWASPYRIYDSEIPAFYGLVRATPLSDNKMLLVWMDGRDTKQLYKDTGRYYPKADGKLDLRSVVVNARGRFSDAQVLTNDISALCPFDVKPLEQGAIMTYRNANNQIAIKHYRNDAWTTPQLLDKTTWKGTTTAAPTVAVHQNQVALLWYTETKDGNQIKFTYSNNSGKDFEASIILSEVSSNGNVQLLWLNAQQLAVSWIEDDTIKVSVIEPTGNVLQEQTIPFQSNQISPRFHLVKTDTALTVFFHDKNGVVEMPVIFEE